MRYFKLRKKYFVLKYKIVFNKTHGVCAPNCLASHNNSSSIRDGRSSIFEDVDPRIDNGLDGSR